MGIMRQVQILKNKFDIKPLQQTGTNHFSDQSENNLNDKPSENIQNEDKPPTPKQPQPAQQTIADDEWNDDEWGDCDDQQIQTKDVEDKDKKTENKNSPKSDGDKTKEIEPKD